MKIADFSQNEISHALSSPSGLTISIGSYFVRIQSKLPSITEGIQQLYKDYPAEINAEYSDFQINVFSPHGLRRWFRPQVLFSNDNYIPFKPLPLNQAFAFLEWGLNWCVAQYINTHLILHAAVIEKEGKAVIMPAPPGSGKSTLCAGLVAKGWRLLSDEMAMVSLETGMLSPIPRPVSLKNESIAIMQQFAEDCFISAPTYDTNKGTVAHMRPPLNSVTHAHINVAPRWIITPHYKANSPSQLVPQTKGQALMMAVNNSFNYNVLGQQGFEAMGVLVDSCQCYEYTYSSLDDALDTFGSLQDLKQEPIQELC